MSTGDGGEGSEDREVPDDPLAGHGDGDVVSFGSLELRGEGQGRPLTARWEIGVAAGKRGDLLALEQTRGDLGHAGLAGCRETGGE
jgi:hypothetical protein